jgi:Flp pilus assembly protein TadG
MTRRRLRHDEQGQTMVEFALVLPIICLLLFGVIQFGILYKDYVTITDAARAGARKAAVSRQEGSPESVVEAKVRASAADLDQTKLAVSVVPDPDWEHGADVTVETQYPYQISLLGLVVASGQLKSTTTERVE